MLFDRKAESRKGIRYGLLIAVMLCFWLLAAVRVSAAPDRTVTIDSCTIQGDQVVCRIKAAPVPASDDGKYYLYADEVWQDGAGGSVAAVVKADANTSVSVPLEYNTPASKLDKKFLVCMKRGGVMVQVSDEHYITNPEAIAMFNCLRMDYGIKGILPDPDKILDGELQDLGVQQVVYNLYIDDICSSAGDPNAIVYTYNGRNYYFNSAKVGYYDGLLHTLKYYNLQVTMVLLNAGRGAFGQDLVHPLARGGSAPGFALNVADAAGTEHLKAIASFLGERWSGVGEYGQVDNWILGNEVNARTEWWYTSSADLDVNVGAYVKAFRIVYNELKAKNAFYNVYNSIDQEWGRKSNPGSFLSREYLDRFNYYILREGNIDWGLSYHPYNSPLYDAYAWNGPAVWVKMDLDTPYITMQNIDLLIAYMHQPHFLNQYGQVRSISLAEIGYTSSFGTAAQEASVAYGYLMARSLPDVDAFMLYRLTDNAHEMQSHLALGLTDLQGNKKPAYNIYKMLGTPLESQAKARASQIIGMDIDTMINNRVLWTRGGDGVVR